MQMRLTLFQILNQTHTPKCVCSQRCASYQTPIAAHFQSHAIRGKCRNETPPTKTSDFCHLQFAFRFVLCFWQILHALCMK